MTATPLATRLGLSTIERLTKISHLAHKPLPSLQTPTVPGFCGLSLENVANPTWAVEMSILIPQDEETSASLPSLNNLDLSIPFYTMT
jgi:hypothetical protein